MITGVSQCPTSSSLVWLPLLLPTCGAKEVDDHPAGGHNAAESGHDEGR